MAQDAVPEILSVRFTVIESHEAVTLLATPDEDAVADDDNVSSRSWLPRPLSSDWKPLAFIYGRQWC
ncbi:hypothetical protein NDU88_007060 [Pleurodeles waltl]|uniref:Uncharacterized protein n=1 Tax=Pleurodeles waltl TaxID=8319 RepID=A0AAV7MFT9_PLEWA|nr:hypothetical protein NDU88_007060 [Pleurodeles waltl]